MRLRVLRLAGVNDRNRIKVRLNTGNLFQSRFHLDGNLPLLEFLGDERIAVATLRLGGLRDSKIRIGEFDLIFNGICDADSNSRSLKMAEGLTGKLSLPVVNEPRRIRETRRDRIAELLEGIEGIRVPRTIRIAPRSKGELLERIRSAGIFPALVREAGTHGGSGMLLVERETPPDRLDRFAFDGRDYYVTEFVDFRDEEGLYRKYRVVFIEGERFWRHGIVSTRWKIHVSGRKELMDASAELREEEERLLREGMPELDERFSEIAARVGLEYFGIDFALTPEGEILLFELNACMNVMGAGELPAPYEYHNARLREIRERVEKMLWKKAGKE
jgi:glutathione synthase/RimK-type ligase-like ATP-grasp enzyme